MGGRDGGGGTALGLALGLALGTALGAALAGGLAQRAAARWNEPAGSASPAAADAADAADAAGASADVDGPDVPLRRLRRVETVLRDRIGRVAVVLERIGNSHNYAAVLRTAEALGFQDVYVVSMNASVLSLQEPRKSRGRTEWKADTEKYELHLGQGRGASRWLTLHVCETAEEAVAALRSKGYDIWTTDLSQKAVALDARDPSMSGAGFPEKVAFVIGTEGSGVSQHFIDAADRRVFLPMRGFADSFNASVAAALMMQQLTFMCPAVVGSLSEAALARLRPAWYQEMARTPEEEAEFAALLDAPPPPFRDQRRSDAHRMPRMRAQDFTNMVDGANYAPGR